MMKGCDRPAAITGSAAEALLRLDRRDQPP